MNSVSTWSNNAVGWMDDKGRGAWIALMVVAFVVAWPVGLAILFFMIWTNRLGKGSKDMLRSCGSKIGLKKTNNSAFENYKATTIKRLKEEQKEFEQFLQRLRDAKDKAEFDQFMDQRRNSVDNSNH